MSRPASLSALPVELRDLILDWLRGDRNTLASCCRVCKDWYPRARYNLFYQV
ncbi:hypothetical protein OH77DRAFT_1365118, partial [Trametes cingulata]